MNNLVDLSIVIPTLNEEKYIGHLLHSIANQSVLPKEVVVVDAFSVDRTKEVVQKLQNILPQLKLYQVPRSTISKQRNFGAWKTTAKHILFLDADVYLRDPDTLEKYIREVERKKPDLAAATNYPLSEHWENWVIFHAADIVFKATKPVWPMALGINLYVSRQAFERVGGFDERIRFAEDHELVQRMVKVGNRFVFLKKPKVYTSTRRMDKEGRSKFVVKMVKSFFYILHYGYHKNPTKYKYGHFK